MISIEVLYDIQLALAFIAAILIIEEFVDDMDNNMMA